MDVTVDGAELQLVLSASLDSSVCIWSLDSGHYLHSVYTFNPLTSLAYIEDRSLFVTGSDGGKLELWDAAVKSPTPLCSVLDHRGAIVDIVVEKKQIYCGSSDGRITGYELMTSDPHVDPQIRQFFDSSTVSDPLTCHLPPILSLAVLQSSLYYADGSTSIKVISSSQGKLRELSNHVTESGSTDAVCIAGGLLVASGYDVDNQLGYVNVRSLPCERYEYTLCDERTSRIHCVVGGLSSTGLLTIATGSDGGPLKLWTQIAADSDRLKESAGVTVKSVYVPRFDLPTPLSISPRSTDDDKELSQSAAAAADNVTLPWRRDVTATPSRFSPWSWCSVI